VDHDYQLPHHESGVARGVWRQLIPDTSASALCVVNVNAD
jgi:hypothetical protein